jgi:hypothetical protein
MNKKPTNRVMERLVAWTSSQKAPVHDGQEVKGNTKQDPMHAAVVFISRSI